MALQVPAKPLTTKILVCPSALLVRSYYIRGVTDKGKETVMKCADAI
jgi:hypothetical protein